MILIKKPRFWENGFLLLGIVYIFSGLIVSIIAFSKLKLLFLQFAPYLPFSVPSDGLERILSSPPLVFSTFVSLMSSVAGFLFGIQWFCSGLVDCIRKTPSTQETGELADKNSILSFLLSLERTNSQLSSCKKSFSINNFLARWFTPGTYGVVYATVRSNFKLLFVVALVLLIARLLEVGPVMLNKHFGFQIAFVVPQFGNLWTILSALVVINLFAALSFISIRKRHFDFESRDLVVSGNGAMVFFLSIFEELCTLVNSRNLSGNQPSRFQTKLSDGTFNVAGLFEGYPNRNIKPANIVVYLLLPMIPCCLIWGFYRLINFQLSAPAMDQHLFFSRYFSSMLLEVAFACFLLFAASHFARLTRLILQISKYESYLIACQCRTLVSSDSTDSVVNHISHDSESDLRSGSCEWQELSGPENDLIEWIKEPEKQRQFSVKITWARASTESSFPSGDRKSTSFERDKELEILIDKILIVLRHVNFESQEASNKIIPDTKT